MRPASRLAAVFIIFMALTASNMFYYSARMRELNSVTLRSNPLGGDAFQIGSQAARDRQNTFWVVEAGIVVICGGAWLLSRGRPDAQ